MRTTMLLIGARDTLDSLSPMRVALPLIGGFVTCDGQPEAVYVTGL